MGRFGWSLPPGCGQLPGEGPDGPCEVCGGNPDKSGEGGCICPECPVCGDQGNPTCYSGTCGMRPNPAQEAQLAIMEKLWAESAETEAVYEAHMERDLSVHQKVDEPYPDRTPPEIKAAVAEAEKCLNVLSRAFDAGIQPKYAANRLFALAQEIAQITHQWLPPNQTQSAS